MGKSNKFSLTTKSHSSTRVNPYDKITLNALNVNCPDKQIVLPKLDSNGAQLIFIELYSLFIFIIALGTQYLNVYRSMWWLSPKARSQTSLNHHLVIDGDVSQFSLLFIGQSSIIAILRALLQKATLPAKFNLLAQYQNYAPSSITSLTTASVNNNLTETQKQQHTSTQSQISQTLVASSTSSTSSSSSSSTSSSATSTNTSTTSTFTTIVTATASWICSYHLFKCAYRIWTNFGLHGLSFVSYPIILSVMLNSTHIVQVFESCCKTGKIDLSFLTLSMTLFSTHIEFNDDKLCHNCSNQPDEIRDEVDRFRTIFNERLKFILYKSLLMAYYAAFVPMCFAQSFLHYDHKWTAQHIGMTWFSSLIMLISSSYSPHFYDVLHRSAYHFGKWQKMPARNTLVPGITWSESVVYPQGVVVKHYRDYFRSESVSNCAQPGVWPHLRYYIVFSDPKIGYVAALTSLGILLTIQMYLLLTSTEWYKLVATASMMCVNVYSIFRLVKSLVVITKIYKTKKH